MVGQFQPRGGVELVVVLEIHLGRGDAQRGQSLVVWAIADGRRAAREVDRYLMGRSELLTPKLAGVLR